MSGDWIKMRADLRTHPKVVRISSALKADRLHVVGGLHAVWCLFDAHSVDGSLDGYTHEAVDDLIGWRGFSAAMAAIGWLENDESCGLRLPDFGAHNGASAKRRAQDADRKRRDREQAEADEKAVRDASASEADKKRTREEKRREEKKTLLAKASEGRFPDFWNLWPSTERKTDRKRCLAKWRSAKLDDQADDILVHLALVKTTSKWTGGYEPAPLRYLNGEQWRDGVHVNGRTADVFAGAI